MLYGQDTDFDMIKSTLEQSISNTREIAQTEDKGSYGYQRAIDNIEEMIIELAGHLSLTARWIADYTPFNIMLLVIYIISLLPLGLLILLSL